MCYDVAYQTKRTLDYARRRAYDQETLEELEEKWERVKDIPPRFHASGFEHPRLIAFTNEAPWDPLPLYWGLIPSWVKDEKSALKLSHQTLNARGESIFEKPAFRHSARKRRCLIIIDHFYEHHHRKGKTFPFLIKLKNNEPMILGGLWSEWVNESSGEVVQSTSIVTTEANELMTRIHNNPRLDQARMPLLLSKLDQDYWLAPAESEGEIDTLKSLIRPYPDAELEAYTVGRLRGKQAVGNHPEAINRVVYPELADLE